MIQRWNLYNQELEKNPFDIGDYVEVERGAGKPVDAYVIGIFERNVVHFRNVEWMNNRPLFIEVYDADNDETFMVHYNQLKLKRSN